MVNAALEIIAEGLDFPEGPVSMPDGSVLVVEIASPRLTRIGADGRKDVIAALTGGPNGAALGPDQSLIICNNGGLSWAQIMGFKVPVGPPADYAGGWIERVDLASGRVDQLYTHFDDGSRLKAPNDLVMDGEGGFWFSDFGKTYDEQLDWGAIGYARLDGSLCKRVVKRVLSPNGVGLSADRSALYYAETLTGRVFGLRIQAPGEIAPFMPHMPGFLVASLPRAIGLDSLAVEESGHVCVATLFEGGIGICDPLDGRVELLGTPDLITTNICFGGADRRDAYITLSGTGKLAKCRWPRPGLKLAYH